MIFQHKAKIEGLKPVMLCNIHILIDIYMTHYVYKKVLPKNRYSIEYPPVPGGRWHRQHAAVLHVGVGKREGGEWK